MAKPPEPLGDVLPKAVWVVDAEVIEVLKTGTKPPQPPSRQGIGGGVTGPEQVLKLKVKRVLKGERIAELVVHKPFAPYQLSVGNKGPFLIDAKRTILGRYGPDSYALAKIEAAIASGS